MFSGPDAQIHKSGMRQVNQVGGLGATCQEGGAGKEHDLAPLVPPHLEGQQRLAALKQLGAGLCDQAGVIRAAMVKVVLSAQVCARAPPTHMGAASYCSMWDDDC